MLQRAYKISFLFLALESNQKCGFSFVWALWNEAKVWFQLFLTSLLLKWNQKCGLSFVFGWNQKCGLSLWTCKNDWNFLCKFAKSKMEFLKSKLNLALRSMKEFSEVEAFLETQLKCQRWLSEVKFKPGFFGGGGWFQCQSSKVKTRRLSFEAQ